MPQLIAASGPTAAEALRATGAPSVADAIRAVLAGHDLQTPALPYLRTVSLVKRPASRMWTSKGAPTTQPARTESILRAEDGSGVYARVVVEAWSEDRLYGPFADATAAGQALTDAHGRDISRIKAT